MTMRKKDYEAIARAISDTRSPPGDSNIVSRDYRDGVNTAMSELAGRVSRYCATQDPTFKRDRFLADCGVSHD